MPAPGCARCGRGLKVHRFEVPDGDGTKNLRQVAKLYDAFLAKGMDRSSAVVALGGGVVGDLAGFAAASYLRGIPFVQVPTSLLAMVDASIGGKVGVNLSQGKNLVGAFHQPRLVWIDTSTLRTLPSRQLAAGMAEVIKAGAILRPPLLQAARKDRIDSVMSLEPQVLVTGAGAGLRDQGRGGGGGRARGGPASSLLNFGHTMAHAVERLSGLSQGAARRGGGDGNGVRGPALRGAGSWRRSGTRERLETLVLRAGLPTTLPEFPRKAYLSAIQVDKKKAGRHIRFVALRGIGRSETVPLTPAEIFPRRR